ncbi:hypothetical protein PR202_gb14749 [Eleusine coracana subsp. coracana]|uniref:MSP domain-containing protein n=1 Tax=Eleusine coracana subsp. coracana TaxID=191504 RepID=A0AAV5ETS6_ELECO|nr:hypothetical protein PR202_gb14749 [Eleusine coracana subsp. coracana]
MSNTLLRVYPPELKIPFEVKKQRSCCMQLTNRTDQCVAFKFTKAPGRVIEAFKLRVVYIAANPPSPVPEEAEEEDSSRSEVVDNEVNRPSVRDIAPAETGVSREEPSCAEGTSVISRFVGQTEYAVDENQMLQEQMEMYRETRSSQQRFSLVFVLLVFMSSVFVGHLMNGVKV